MIAFEELYKSQDLGQIDHDSLLNLQQLHYRVNFLRHLYGKPLKVNRGFSTPEEQIAIYNAKKQPPKMGSLHLIGAAVDFDDSLRDFQAWLLVRVQILEALALYAEQFEYTPTWVHLQIYPPLSGRRFFIP